jgi:hypothetical protein
MSLIFSIYSEPIDMMKTLGIHFVLIKRCAVKEKYPFNHAASMSLDSLITDENMIKDLILKEDGQDEEEENKKT